MNRNKNVDVLRVGAILAIIAYHSYMVCGSPWAAREWIHKLIGISGELGVTLFLVLSGYGIFMSLWNKEHGGKFPSWKDFMLARCRRIMPSYYFCVGFLLIFQSAHLLSRTGIWHVFAYATFTQNLTVATHGSVNGALWTMAVIFQFYLIAIWLYWAVRKKPILSAVSAVAVTIGSKWLIYKYMIPDLGLDTAAYFVYGRQLISSLDNFVFGMIAALLSIRIQEKTEKKNRICLGISVFLLLFVGLAGAGYYFSEKGLYGCYFEGCAGHSIIAALFASLVVVMSVLPQIRGRLAGIVQFLAKNQYETYLWHMPIITALYSSSELFQNLSHTNFTIYGLSMMGIAVLAGWITGKFQINHTIRRK